MVLFLLGTNPQITKFMMKGKTLGSVALGQSTWLTSLEPHPLEDQGSLTQGQSTWLTVLESQTLEDLGSVISGQPLWLVVLELQSLEVWTLQQPSKWTFEEPGKWAGTTPDSFRKLPSRWGPALFLEELHWNQNVFTDCFHFSELVNSDKIKTKQNPFVCIFPTSFTLKYAIYEGTDCSIYFPSPILSKLI